MSHELDTIVAVSSPPGRSARGLIRMCGPESQQVLRACGIDWPQPRRVQRVCMALSSGSAPRLLPMLMTVFVGPRSYTGLDMVELQLPGHPALLERVLHRFLDAGARLAQPGEFTFLAYTHGKLDLTRAEGVAATIAATSDAQLEAAGHLRRGELGQFSQRLVEQLATLLALVEAGIDFVDQEDVVPISAADLLERLDALHGELSRLLDHSQRWADLEVLPRVVLAGPPSVGKSTLFNALLGHERMVIDALPGTTRDVIEESVVITTSNQRRIEIMLVDMAGLDDVAAILDHAAQSAARAAMQSANLILDVHCQADAPVMVHDRSTLRVRTKVDDANDIQACREWQSDDGCPALVSVHAPTGRGLDYLRDAIGACLNETGPTARSEGLTLQPRHEQALRDTQQQVDVAREHLRTRNPGYAIEHIELVASILRTGLDHLGELGGQMTPDDVIGRVFATFCVGK